MPLTTQKPLVVVGKESIAKAYAETSLYGALTNLENGSVDHISSGKGM